ncbi:hypothetical protein V5799_034025 [Amblyomma americanum]|uniref:Uncharacterized protein n=1 Tax=Amblyomma americanum TaxID=6943 RepID=A0AAQ4DLM3_AMBAM
MTDNASQLEDVLRDLAGRGFGVQTFSKAVNAAKNIHANMEPQARMERVRNVYQKVKTLFEAERARKDKLQEQLQTAPDDISRQELHRAFEACELRVKSLNLVLLYYASGLKHIYEEHDEGTEHSEGAAGGQA